MIREARLSAPFTLKLISIREAMGQQFGEQTRGTPRSVIPELNLRRHEDFGFNPQVLVSFPYRQSVKLGDVPLGSPEHVGQQYPDLSKIRGLRVRLINVPQLLLGLGIKCIRAKPFVDVLRIIVVLHAEDEEEFLVVEDDLVPINPALADVLDILEYNKLVACPE